MATREFEIEAKRLPYPTRRRCLSDARSGLRELRGVFLCFLGLVWIGPAIESKEINDFGELAGNCHRFEFRQQESSSSYLAGQSIPASLAWTTSGFWGRRSAAGSDMVQPELTLVDHTFPGLLSIVPGGFIQPQASLLATAAQRLIEPLFAVARSDGGFLIYDVGTRTILFGDENGESKILEIDLSLPFLGDSGPIDVKAVWGGSPLASGLLALAEIIVQERHETVLVYLDRNYQYQVFDLEEQLGKDASLHEVRHQFYALDFSYIGTVHDTGYLLVQEEQPWIAKVQLGSSEVSRLPLPGELNLQFQKRDGHPVYPRSRYLNWRFGAYRSIERQRMPAGLYAWGERLYLVVKGEQHSLTDETPWQLVELSNTDGHLLDVMELPTRAAQIAVVPGDDYFAIIEKGGIDTSRTESREFLVRSVASTVLVPARWIFEREAPTEVACGWLQTGDE